MIWRVFLTLAAALAGSAATAQLKPEIRTGSLIPVKPESVPEAEAAAVRKAFAQCMYRRNPAKADALVRRSDPVAVDYEGAGVPFPKLKATFGMAECLGRQIRVDRSALGTIFPDNLLRAMFQEEAYLALQQDAPTLVPRVTGERRFFAAPKQLGTAQAMAAFADCLAGNDAPAADRLLRTMPGSDEEKAAARSLAPVLGACLTQGETLKLTPLSIRSFAADGLWNRYVAGSPATQPAG